MAPAAPRLLGYTLLFQLLVGLAAFIVFVTSAPQLLLLDAAETRAALLSSMYVAVAAELMTVIAITRRVGRLRYVLRALLVGTRALVIQDIVDLDRVPTRITAIAAGWALFFSFTSLFPPFRASGLDLPTAMSLFLLSSLVIVAFSLPLYFLLRSAVSRAIEFVPPDIAGEALAELEGNDIPSRRIIAHMVVAVVTPVSFVALGAALVASAHVRYAVVQARANTAVALARAAGDPLEAPVPSGGSEEAVAAFERMPYELRLSPSREPYELRRRPDGKFSVRVPLTAGHGEVVFGVRGQQIRSPSLLSASVFALLFSLSVGFWIGRRLSDDLYFAARQVRTIGNERALQGAAHFSAPTRFRVVAALERSIESLAERFREFADAQERAIEAREATLRLRGLLFASVSHDLKSPLNAVLGFCALAAAEPLSENQLESVEIIERRGRELLALIENILDAARVEAQRMTLEAGVCDIGEIIKQAVQRGDELGPMDAAAVHVSVSRNLPPVLWDAGRMAQAIAALVGHSKRLNRHGGVKLKVRMPEPGTIRITVTDPSDEYSLFELVRLLDARNAATAPRRSGGLALGISLSRALIRLHGGSLDVAKLAGGGVQFVAHLPLQLVVGAQLDSTPAIPIAAPRPSFSSRPPRIDEIERPRA